MNRPAKFFESVRAGILGPSLIPDEVTGCDAILTAMEGAPLSWTAYALATAYHETAHTMLPIKEFGGQAYFRRMYDIQGNNPTLARRLGNTVPGDGAQFAGRGYVQLTGRANYARASTKLGVDLIRNPDLAMDPAIAAKIMRRGMTEGWFTGKSFASYLPGAGVANKAQYTAARRIINGTDRAALIESYAQAFEKALRAGGYQ